ncbi:class I adenylate-forming enzyme family protein [Metabacillus bambusae]|uniref:Acyl--CoA ligase n=1 Tax=Metabacillus bambusae TaxID=2795218 RepID=A0ABS3N6K9_9BACI|nr:class I adenylate-forming enzyme family protein [Metabacillus bambusae]MBO1513936.1 acyl--CoA ligase [Metabacillus bambusae]
MANQTFSDWIFSGNADMKKTSLSTVRGEYSLEDIKEKRDQFIQLLNGCSEIKGKKVGVMIPQVESFLGLALAVNELGGILIPLSWQFRKDDLTAVLEFLSPHVVFSINENNGFNFEEVLIKWAQETNEECIIYTTSNNTEWVENKFEGDEKPVEKDRIDVIGCSSGSTGIPKGLMLGNENLDSWINDIQDFFELNTEDVFFSILPPTAPVGLATILLSLRKNAHLVIPDSFDPITIGRILDEKSCNKLYCTPSIFKSVYKIVQKTNPGCLQILKKVGFVGEMISQELIDLVDSFPDTQFINSYGSSEGGAMLYSELREKEMRGFNGVEFKLFNVDGQEDIGELLARGKGVFSGYYKRPDLTDEVLKDGWYHTGDLVKSLGNNRYILIERIKNMIKKGGQAVIPGEVEYVLTQHPNVKQAAVIGVPHTLYGEQVIAFVVPEGNLNVQELYSHCSRKIAAIKVPDKILQIEAIPLIQGKTDRLTLRKMIETS